MIRSLIFLFITLITLDSSIAQKDWDEQIAEILPTTLKRHREFVSLPNVSAVPEDMDKNFAWARDAFEARGFEVRMLESTSIPVFFAERLSKKKKAKTILFYLHIDGQPANAENWDQDDPFVPVLKQPIGNDEFEIIDWSNLDGTIDELSIWDAALSAEEIQQQYDLGKPLGY